MKKLILLALVWVLVLVQAQSQIPNKVDQTFEAKYANAREVEWDYDDESNYYIAHFVMSGREKQALFSESGGWIQTKTVYDKDELPAAVSKTVDEKYPGFFYDSCDLLETKDAKYYEIVISFEDSFIIKVTKEGRFLSEEQIFEEDEDY